MALSKKTLAGETPRSPHMSINLKVNVKRKFIVNGVEYGSPEEMPPEIRAAYEKTVQSGAALSASGYFSLGTKQPVQRMTKITVNGQTYDSVEAMPEDIRRLYEDAMRAAGTPAADGAAMPVTPLPPAASGPLLREKQPRDDRQPVNGGASRILLLAAAVLFVVILVAAISFLRHAR